MRWIADLLLVVGAVSLLLSALALLRLDPALERLRAALSAATLGALAILIGLTLLCLSCWNHLLLLALLILLVNPLALTRIAGRHSRRPAEESASRGRWPAKQTGNGPGRTRAPPPGQ